MSALAELKALLNLDATQYKAEAKQVTSLTSSFQKSISGIGGMLAGAFSVGALISFGKSLMNTAHEMDKIAEATNMTMGQLVALKTIGAENGLEFDDMSKVLGKVRDAQGQLVNLSKKHEDALKSLKISADDFVGAGTDKALELIAQAYVKAGGSAEAFAAINELFGGKIGRKTIETLIALDKEGLGPLAERTKEATKGFEEMAKAQATLERAGNTVQLWAAAAVGAIERVGAALGELSVEIEQKGFKKGLQDYFAFSEAGPETALGVQDMKKKKSFTGLFTGDADIKPNADQIKRKENLAAEAKKKADKENEKAQELGRKYYFKELKNQDELENLYADYANSGKGLSRIKGQGENVDSMMRVGGLVGGARPGLAAEDRQLRVLTESKEIWREMNIKLQKLVDKQETERDRNEG